MIITWHSLNIDRWILKTKINDGVLAFAGIGSSIIALMQSFMNSQNTDKDRTFFKKQIYRLI